MLKTLMDKVDHRQELLFVSSDGRKARELSGVFSIRALTPFIRAPPS